MITTQNVRLMLIYNRCKTKTPVIKPFYKCLFSKCLFLFMKQNIAPAYNNPNIVVCCPFDMFVLK